ncbi:MAG: hypothetical protein Q4F74_07575, partial [Synergistaceae bacterium]|nr:hypothetical protein [Synergistaceae bacterium]
MEKDKTFSRSSLAVIALCIAVNLGGVRLTLLWDLPVFLDCVGTVLCAALCGYLPAIVVGFLTNGIVAISSPTMLYFSIINVLLAVTTVPFAKRGYFRKYLPSLVTLPPLVFVGGFLGSLLTWLLFGLNFGTGRSAQLATAICREFIFNNFAAQLTADIALNTIDKFITISAVYVVIKTLPKKLFADLPLGCIYDESLRGGEPDSKTRKISMRTKSAAFMIFSAIVISAAATGISFMIYETTMNKRYMSTCESAATLADNAIDGDDVRVFLETGERMEGLEQAERTMYRIQAGIHDIVYMYVLRIEKGGAKVVIDLRPAKFPDKDENNFVKLDEKMMAKLGGLMKYGQGSLVYDGPAGRLLTVYRPILDSWGDLVAYVAADISMKSVVTDRLRFFIEMASLLFAVSILITAISLRRVQRTVVAPLNALASAAGKFAYESEADRQKNMEML